MSLMITIFFKLAIVGFGTDFGSFPFLIDNPGALYGCGYLITAGFVFFQTKFKPFSGIFLVPLNVSNMFKLDSNLFVVN